MNKKILYALIFFVSFESMGAETVKVWLKKYCYSFLPVYTEARKHVVPELDKCKDFVCFKNKLYKEEEEALEVVFDEYSIPLEDRKKIKAQFADLATYNPLFSNDYYPNPDKQLQDKEKLGEIVNKTRQMLKEYGINPDAVRMDYDEAYFKKNPKSFAAADSPYYGDSARIRYDVEGVNGIKFSADKHIHDIAHEVTHIKEFTGLKCILVRKLIAQHGFSIGSDMYNNPSSVSDSYRAWTRVHEKHAQLFPLFDFGSSAFDNFVDNQIKQCNSMQISDDQWNKSSVLATHPECTELLPPIVKIQDLEKKGAKPLIRRLDPSDLNIFEKDEK